MDQVAKQSTVDRIAQAQNVLVTVSANPSVDQLAACIALTLFLNKQGKHATAVFSGEVPSTLEFLQPEKTIEKNTDSLRDFIISLDKAKADKLRYKVEDNVVRIFITPYRTSISEKDFDFSQGDFNIDVVMALGVHSKEELDHAIIAHGRILHDATVISINNAVGGSLGTINWQDQQASSLCEMLVELSEIIKADSFDAQMATAFLTGIVAETKRFSNEKTTSRTMSLAAKLMAAGANQQLVATQLQSKSSITPASSGDADDGSDDGALEIDHSPEKPVDDEPEATLPEPQPDTAPVSVPEPPSPIGDVRGENHPVPTDLLTATPTPVTPSGPSFPNEPPSRGGTLTANTKPEDLSSAVDPLSQTKDQPILQRGHPGGAADNNLGDKTISKIEEAVVDQDKTLADIEQVIDSPHAAEAAADPAAGLDTARNAVAAAADSGPAPRLEPRKDVAASGRLDVGAAPAPALGSAPIAPMQVTPTPAVPPVTSVPPATPDPDPAAVIPDPAQTPTPAVPASPIPPDAGLPPEKTGVTSAPAAPPPVPPPMSPSAFPPQNS